MVDPIASGCRPPMALGWANAMRNAVKPTMAKNRGWKRSTFRRSEEAPARSSSAESSSAVAVVRATMLVMPRFRAMSERSSKPVNGRGVKPEAWRAGQNRLPGRAKWWPVAEE